MLALERLNKVVDETVVGVFSTKTGVTGGGLDLKDTLLDSQERYNESFSTQVENESVPFAGNLLIKSVRDKGGGRLINDTKDVEIRNCTSILCGLTLRVVKVGGDVTTAFVTVPLIGSPFIFTRLQSTAS